MAVTASIPIPVTEAASPKLNATIKIEPVADPMEGDRGEQDDERRRARDDPTGDADTEQAARIVVVAVLVVVVVVVVVVPARVCALVPPLPHA